jgi:hypothetical protein
MTRAALAAAALSSLVLAACSHAARPASAPAPVTMAYCGSGPQVRPGVVELVCGTNEITADRLTWATWGKQVATAVGTAVVDLCTYEDCHTGSYRSVPIVVIASDLVRCASRQAYSRLQYVFVGGSPFPVMPANIKFPPNDIVGATRSIPAPDQTVSLSC